MDSTNVTPDIQNEVLVEQTVPIAQGNAELAVLTADSIQRFDPQVQAQIMRVANDIDPMQLDKILAYGSIPLIRTYESAGQILKAAEGTSVDQDVIDQVVELAKLANKGQEDVNISLKEPNWMEKILMNIFTSIKEKRNDDTQVKAVTCYRLLTQLKEKCEVWHTMLQENWRLICQSIFKRTIRLYAGIFCRILCPLIISAWGILIINQAIISISSAFINFFPANLG